MRFYEFKIVESKILNEGTRGIIGVVLDNQSGKENEMQLTGGGKFEPIAYYLYPKEKGKLAYQDEIIQTPVPSPDNADPETPGNDKLLSADEQFQADLEQDNLAGAKMIEFGVKGKKFGALVIEVATDRGKELFLRYNNGKNNNEYYNWQVTQFKKELATKGISIEAVVRADSEKVHPEARMFPNSAAITDQVLAIDNVSSTLRQSTGGKLDLFSAEERAIVADLIDAMGTGKDVATTNDYRRNYEVQAGEIAAPVALKNNVLVSGNYIDAQQQLLEYLEKGLTWAAMSSVEFPSNEAEELVDSFMISPKGNRIGISSKDGGGGAKASASSIANILEKNRDKILERVPNFFDDPVNSKMLRYMEIINEPNKSEQMYKFAAETKHITSAQKDKLIALLNKGGEDYNNPQAMIDIVGADLYNKCMNNYKPRNINDPRYRVFFHFTCGLAKFAAATMNADTDVVDRFFRTCLESSNMVQVKCKYKQNGDQGSYQNFQVIYPPIFKGTIRFNPFKKLTANVKPEGMAFEIGK